MKNALIIVAIAALLGLGAWYYTTMNPAPAYNPAGTQETGTETPTDTPTGDTQTTFTMAQIAEHNSDASCYTAIRGSVYDLTSWIGKHPGGESEIRQLCGKDGTEKFVGQHGGMAQQESALVGFKIGTVAQ
jgi:cytochrome b involved in lipid metabolism